MGEATAVSMAMTEHATMSSMPMSSMSVALLTIAATVSICQEAASTESTMSMSIAATVAAVAGQVVVTPTGSKEERGSYREKCFLHSNHP